MATVLWNSQGIIFIDYLPEGQTITEAYYATLLTCLKDELRTKSQW